MIQRFAYVLTFFFLSLWCFCLSNLPKHYFETFWIASLGSFSKPHFPLKNIMLLKDLFVVSRLLIFFFLFTYGYFHIPLFLFIFLVKSQHCGWESSCICGTCDRNAVSFKLRHSAIKISVFFRIWSPLFFLL